MEIAYLNIIILTHIVFALVFLFLHRQQYGVLRYFAVAWILQAIRALLLLESRRSGTLAVPGWIVQDIASLVFTALLLLGSAYFVKKRFSRRRVILYFSLTIAFVLAIRFLIPDSFFQAPGSRNYACFFFTMVVATVGRTWAMIWFFQVWRKTRFSGALIAATSLLFPQVAAIVAPIQIYYYSYYSPHVVHLFWFLQGLGLSLGVIMLVLTEQGAERVQAERALGASEERYRKLFERSPLPMFVFDLETLRFLAVNEATVRHYGYSRAEFLSMTLAEIRPSEEIPVLMDSMSRWTPADIVGSRRRHRTKDGRIINVEANSHELDFQGKRARMVIIIDVTERGHLEERLRLSQRLEAVGRLAGGIAHDFNNLLTAILGTSELLMPRVGPAERADLNEIHNAGERGAALVRQMLAFGRKQMLEPRVLDLSALVGEIGKLLERAMGKGIELCMELDPRPCPVKADPGQLEQVLLNLALNARDSMPDGGRLTIRTRQRELSESESQRRGYSILPGKYSVLVVSDTGIGMDAQTCGQIFEPFFTTKEQGKGSGLGLATSYGIVKQSGGHISCESELGRGTTFEILLPYSDEAPALQSRQDQPSESAGGVETILLVEDEEAVRRLCLRILEARGYRVVDSATPQRALTLAREYPERLDLLLTDVVMPGLSGPQLAEEVLALRPQMKVLFMSGYTEGSASIQGTLDSRHAFLRKPFSADALSGKVREILDSTESTGSQA